MNITLQKKSREMSYLLRHEPEDLKMDKNGYVLVTDLLKKLNISLQDLEEIISENDKKRFSFNNSKDMVRASQGHSIEVDVQLKATRPPRTLYHGTMVGVGGNTSIKKAYITTTPNKQSYDLMVEAYDMVASQSFSTLYTGSATIDVTRVYFEATPAIQRFFDPYSVGGMGTLNLMDEMGFGQYSPAAQFLLMPIYEDLLRMQAIEFNDTIRKSAHTFNIVDNKLQLFPIPTDRSPVKIFFEYMSRSEFEDKSLIFKPDSISDYSDAKYDFIQYSHINDVGRQWIRKYTLALAKELLGAIREKYSSIPIPDGEVSLDGAALRAEAQVEKDNLIEQLRLNLDELSRKVVFQNQAEEAEHHQDMLRKIPLKIYVG